MIRNTLLRSLLLASLLGLAGCTAVTSVTHQGTIEDNYGKRTAGEKLEDHSIETKISHNLGRTDSRLGDARINVDSFNGVVLLTGQVPSEELRETAGEVAGEVRNVRDVHNELSVAGNLPASQKLSDTWLTARIRANLAANERIDASRIRVVTENASIYLMGMVSRDEGQRIADAVAEIGGMQRIVKVFDYID
ncbi:MAG: BON domain-containing protein [Halomonas sp.]